MQDNQAHTPTESSALQSPLTKYAQYGVVGLALVAFVLLLFTDRSALQGSRGGAPVASATPASSGSLDQALLPASLKGLALPELPAGPDGQSITQLLKQLSSAPAAEQPEVLDRLVAACLNIDRLDLAAGAQQALAERTARADDWHKALRLYAQAAERAASAGSLSPAAAEQNQRARTVAEQWLSTHPSDVTAQVQQALLNVHSGDPARIMPNGIQALIKIAEANPNDLEAPLALSRFALQTGQLDRAAQRLSTLLKTHPGHPEASLIYSDVLVRQKKLTEARSVVEAALAATRDPAVLSRLQAAKQAISVEARSPQ